MQESEKKLKRMIYVYEENLQFYNSLNNENPLGNKSEFINRALQAGRLGNQRTPEEKPSEAGSPEDQHPDPRIRETHRAVAAMEEKARAARTNVQQA